MPESLDEQRDTSPPPPPTHCKCGRSFSADDWQKLAYVGIMDDGVDRIELRHCPCSSTISIELPRVSVIVAAGEREQLSAVKRTTARLRSVGIEP